MGYNYCYLVETFDTPAEHINPAGNVVGAIINEYRDELGIISSKVGGIYDGELDGYNFCQGCDFPEDFGVDGMLSEDKDRSILHTEVDEDYIIPEVVDEYWYTLMDFEI